MIISCTACTANHEIAAATLAAAAPCPRCGADLLPLARPLDVDGDTLDEVIAAAPLPILVDFWSDGCGPCRRASFEVKQTAAAAVGRAIVLKVDTGAHRDLASRYRVDNVPNFIVFNRGRMIAQKEGVVDSGQLLRWLMSA